MSIAEVSDDVVGYVAVDLPPAESHGEIYMIAVDPNHQGSGIGSALTEHAIEQIRPQAAIWSWSRLEETPATLMRGRPTSTYEKLGFVSLPAERYYLLA